MQNSPKFGIEMWELVRVSSRKLAPHRHSRWLNWKDVLYERYVRNLIKTADETKKLKIEELHISSLTAFSGEIR